MSLLLNDKEYCSFHFVGVLGSGMSAIAQYCAWHGLSVTGSDRLYNHESTRKIQTKLEMIGCRIFPQDGSGISSKSGAIVLSTAIEKTNPDCIQAATFNLTTLHRSDVLAAIVATRQTIAVAGTSGKSTVTALLFHLLTACGKKPSLITGANLHTLINRNYIGNAFYDDADLLIVEADESDGSLIKYHPSVSIFLNLSKDHKPVEEILPLFQTLARQSDTVFTNADDPLLDAIPSHHTFGFSSSAGYRPDRIITTATSAGVLKNGISFTIPFPGKHNAIDLLAALSVCSTLRCADDALAHASTTFQGLQRRFDRITTKKNITVIDDYAHNPEKLSAAIQTAQSLAPRVHALFQPHGFGPTKFLLHDLIAVFSKLLRAEDTLYLLPVYYAGGTVARDISSNDIAQGLRSGKATILTPKDQDEAVATLVTRSKPGDIIISMGARDPSLPLFAQKIARTLDG